MSTVAEIFWTIIEAGALIIFIAAVLLGGLLGRDNAMSLENREEGAVPVQKDVGRHTPAPWEFRIFAMSEDHVEEARRLGIPPTRLLGNDGSATVSAGSGEDRKPVARVECQTKYKRGEGYRTECAERDANARLIAAAPDLLESLQELRAVFVCDAQDDYSERVDQVMNQVDAAIAKATGAKP